MSFFKKLTKEFEGLRTDKDRQSAAGIDSLTPSSSVQTHTTPVQGKQNLHDKAPRGAASSYYDSHPGHAPPQAAEFTHSSGTFGAVQPGLQGSHSSSSLPPGWVQQWDASSQRNYYLETSTGRSQWEPPHLMAAPVPGAASTATASYGQAPPTAPGGPIPYGQAVTPAHSAPNSQTPGPVQVGDLSNTVGTKDAKKEKGYGKYLAAAGAALKKHHEKSKAAKPAGKAPKPLKHGKTHGGAVVGEHGEHGEEGSSSEEESSSDSDREEEDGSEESEEESEEEEYDED